MAVASTHAVRPQLDPTSTRLLLREATNSLQRARELRHNLTLVIVVKREQQLPRAVPHLG